MITQIIPIRFNNNRNILTNVLEKNDEVINIENKNDIKVNIEHFLFVERFNTVLINFNNELFVCEPISIDDKTYSRRKVEYHPLMNKFSV